MSRSWLYQIAKYLGDWNALRSGRLPERLGRRIVWRWVTKLLHKLF